MTIFADVNELKHCVMEMENLFPLDDYHQLMKQIDSIKKLDYDDETKQHICNNELRKILLKNEIVPSYKIIDWLKNRREEYLDLMAYIESDRQWKMKKNIATE
tara:strand:+ start:3503 stop:3811 length:309 start_codon:yes stop_codon:yes gene_type:complete